jgi:hypothetical protein
MRIARAVDSLFHAQLLDAIQLSDGKTPSGWGHALTTGHYVHGSYGAFDVTLADLDRMVHNFSNVTPKQGELPVDYAHTSRDPKTIDQNKAAGWIKKCEVRNRDEARGYGELWLFTEFTEPAADAIKKKELRYYSAEFRPHFTHKNTGEDIGPTLVSAALCIRPFVEGLNAITLTDKHVSDVAAAIRLGDPTASLDVEASMNDLLTDISQQVYQRFGYASNVRDVFGENDGQCVIVEMNGKMYRVEWTMGDDGDPVLGNTLTEVKAQYSPALTDGDPAMAKMKIKVGGKEIEVEESALLALADPKPPTTTAAASTPSADVVALTDGVKQLATLVSTLVERDTNREKASSETQAKARVAQLIKDRKLLKKQEAWAVNYALTDAKGFGEYEATLVPLFSTNERGSGQDGGDGAARRTHTRADSITGESITATDGDQTQTGAEAEFNEKVADYQAKHPKVALKDAIRAVALADPDLEHRRREEMENAVIPITSRAGNRHAEHVA